MTDKLVLGIDVSKAWLDIAVNGHVERIANEEAAITAFLDRLGVPRIAVVAFEPTGGYERALIVAAAESAAPLRRVHPNALVAFRAACRLTAKTDALDAQLIADYARAIPAVHGFEAPVDAVLRGLVVRRRQLLDMRHAERCRRDIAEPALLASHDAVIACLTDQAETIEKDIAERLKDHQRLASTLIAVKGVAMLSAATFIAELPELGCRSAKTIAALVGLAPRTRQSGTLKRRATVGHGRRGVRMILFNATRTAIRCNPVIKDFFQRLVARGKPGRVAFTAAMRKLLVILNAKTRDALAQPA